VKKKEGGSAEPGSLFVFFALFASIDGVHDAGFCAGRNARGTLESVQFPEIL
jgi:hypothetical protein